MGSCASAAFDAGSAPDTLDGAVKQVVISHWNYSAIAGWRGNEHALAMCAASLE